MNNSPYPLREALLSCGVMFMTASFTVILLGLIGVLLVTIWS